MRRTVGGFGGQPYMSATSTQLRCGGRGGCSQGPAGRGGAATPHGTLYSRVCSRVVYCSGRLVAAQPTAWQLIGGGAGYRGGVLGRDHRVRVGTHDHSLSRIFAFVRRSRRYCTDKTRATWFQWAPGRAALVHGTHSPAWVVYNEANA